MVKNKTGILLLGDTHVEEDSIEELSEIFDEVFKIPAKHFIQLGDLCDKNVLNAEEVKFLTYIMKETVSRFNTIGALIGNHDAKDNNIGITDYLEYLNVKMFPDEKIITENGIDPILLGHFFLDKSLSSFGHYRYTVDDILKKKCKFYLLGHQHDFQKIDESIFHLGSARFVSFAENETVKKRVAWIHDDIIEFIELNNVIPIYNVSDIKSLESLPDKAKVRYTYKSFYSLREEIAIVNKIKPRFYKFKSVIKFQKEEAKKSEEKNYNQIVKNYIDKIEDQEVKTILLEEYNNVYQKSGS